MILLFTCVITAGIGGGGGVSPPQWFWGITWDMVFYEEHFEPTASVQFLRIFNMEPLRDPGNYSDLKVHSYCLKFSTSYPFFYRSLFISPCVSYNYFQQVIEVWREGEYMKLFGYLRGWGIGGGVGFLKGATRFLLQVDYTGFLERLYFTFFVRRVFV